MRRLPGLRLLPATAFSLALVVPAVATAQFQLTNNTGSATATTYFGPGSFLQPQTVTTTFGPIGGVALSDIDLRNFGRIRAVQTGYGLNAVFVDALLSDLPFFDWSARTKYDVEVQQTGQSRASLDFQYHLNGGRLALVDPSESFDGLVATVGVSIFAISPGFSGFLWSWVLTLRGSQGVVTPSVEFVLDPMGFGVPVLSPLTVANGVASIDIGSFTANANLGILSGNNTAFVTYDMNAGVGGPGYNVTGGRASLGDPFNASGDYGSGISFTSVPVGVAPEPSTVVLLATALGTLGVVGRSRARRRTA